VTFLKHRLAVAMTLLSLGAIALLGLVASPAGVALRPGMNQALQALSAARPIINVSADSGCVTVTGGCIPASVSLGSNFALANKIAITGNVTATCGPFFGGSSGFSAINLSVSQAAGRQVSHAFTSTTPTCDGTPHTYTLTAVASNLTFRKGSAVATAEVVASGYDINFTFIQEDATSTQTVSLK
jgi:hypothetical protein